MHAKTFSRAISRIICVFSLVLVFGCSNERSESAQPSPVPSPVIKTLLDFESPEIPTEIKTESANTRMLPGKGLEILFSGDVYRPTVQFIPEKPWDWSAEKDFHIAVEAENTGAESVQLYLSLTDFEGPGLSRNDTGNHGNTANRSVNLAAGEAGTYYAVMDGPSLDVDTGLRENPPPWSSEDEMFLWRFGNKNLDLGKITEIALFIRGPLAEKSVLIKSISLRRNPKHNQSYLEGFVDEFGQNAKQDYPIKIHSLEELKQAADLELESLQASGPMPDRSRFGGWKDGPQLEASGFFRTEKVDGKWWMVDPDGYLFFSNGLANVRMANLTTLTGEDFRDESVRYVDPDEVTPEDSLGIIRVPDEVRATRYVASPLRRNMFGWLPGYEDELADHFSYRRSVRNAPIESGETFSFYRANLERRYGETAPASYVRKWEEVTLSRMLDWGFTSMGNWVDPAFYPNERVPYFANGWIIGDFKTLTSKVDVWSPMPDPFDPEFVRRAETTINVIAEEVQASPWCVGVFVDNEKSWGFREGTVEQRYGLIIDALSRDATQSPAKAAFTRHLQEKYNRIEALNSQWGLQAASWETFSSGIEPEEFTPSAIADLSALLELLSNEYFRVVHDALQGALPNHLYMGVRMANWGMPDETVKASIKYSDVLSFNVYESGIRPQSWSFLEEIDLPALVGEWHIGATRETGLFHPGLVMADGQADRAARYTNYMESVAAHDSFVGAHWFQYVDSPITGRAFDGENYNVGFVSVTDIPYPEMVAAAKEFNSTLYPKRYGEKR